MSTHVYQPLEGPEHIRLIALHPALSKDARLEISFLSSNLEDLEGRYEAISYTWGEPILTFALHVDDGTQVCVTKNLDRALRYLRYDDRDRLLWADAACINQSDHAEKAVQIPLMVQIFQGARKVMAWLDSGGDTTVERRGMRIIERLSRTSKMQHETSADDYRQVVRFITLPWFNRLWVVQEVVFSLEVSLICGDTELTFLRLIAALPLIREGVSLFNADDRARVDAIATIGKLWSYHSLFGTESMRASPELSYTDIDSDSNGITSLMQTFASYACTDPRDRLYALFSMAANVQPAAYVSDAVTSSTFRRDGVVHMNIDYSLNVRETFKAFAIRCWKESNTHPDMWEALFMRQHSSRPDNWPSWVPDWHVVPKDTPSFNKMAFNELWQVACVNDDRIWVSSMRYRLLLDKDHVQPYVVKSKVPLEPVGSRVSLESQLLQLSDIINGSATAQTYNPSTDGPQPTSRVLDTTQFPELLYKTIGKRVLGHDSHSDDRHDGNSHDGNSHDGNSHDGNSHDGNPHDEDILHKLVEHFSLELTTFGGRVPRYWPTSFSNRQDHFPELDQASMDLKNLFVFHDPGTQVNSIGYGNVAPEIGDHILPVETWTVDGIHGGLMVAMILRPADSLVGHMNNIPTYRFIGSGCIYDPTSVLRMYSSETYEGGLARVMRSGLKYQHVYEPFNWV